MPMPCNGWRKAASISTSSSSTSPIRPISRSASCTPRPFYRLLEKRLSAHGLIVVQSTSPLYARQSFWCVVTTLEAVGFKTAPYHALVPSFGEWGFIIAGRPGFSIAATVDPKKTRFLTPETTPGLFRFPGRHGAPAGRGQSAQQSGAGALLRGRVAQGCALNDCCT
jgi:hypothetical protein